MAVQDRKDRERADRHRRIVAVARELAEDQGWDAVTTRRLAERIEYSQPVLYGHFPGGKDAIVAAVALEGFAELATTLRAAVHEAAVHEATVHEAAVHEATVDGGAADDGTGAGGAADAGPGHRAAVSALAAAYLGFAARHPATYTAMFDLAALPFARDDTPAPLLEGFAVLRDTLAPAAPDAPDTYAELGWATLHGLATLARAGRLPPEGAGERLALAVDLLAPT